MRGNIEAYKRWAPDGAQWTEWVKPVLFANMPRECRMEELDIPELRWISQCDKSTAIIVDLPGKEGALEGFALACLGHRPIPLYNSTSGASIYSFGKAIVSVDEIMDKLHLFSHELPKLKIRADAPPVFLLDSNRMRMVVKHPGDYDNRWCVFPQDMPSANYLISKGIRNVVVRAEKIRDDLAHILRRYQEQGIAIFEHNGFHQKPVTVAKPSGFKSLFHRFTTLMGLTRNSAGGFGGLIPTPSESSGSGYGGGYRGGFG
jgi:hypothetical protein